MSARFGSIGEEAATKLLQSSRNSLRLVTPRMVAVPSSSVLSVVNRLHRRASRSPARPSATKAAASWLGRRLLFLARFASRNTLRLEVGHCGPVVAELL